MAMTTLIIPVALQAVVLRRVAVRRPAAHPRPVAALHPVVRLVALRQVARLRAVVVLLAARRANVRTTASVIISMTVTCSPAGPY